MKKLMLMIALCFAVALSAFPAHADPVLLGTAHGVSKWGPPSYSDEFEAAVPGGSSGDQLLAVFATGRMPDSGGACPYIDESGWVLVFHKPAGSPTNGYALCAFKRTSDGTETSITVFRPDMNGVAWWIGRITNGNTVTSAVALGGNPPTLGFGTPAATVVVAAQFGVATTPPAGYTLDFAAATGGLNSAALSVAYAMAYGASEDPAAFAPLGSIAATIGIR